MTTQHVLHVYQAPSGQYSGRLFSGDIELCAVAGCDSLDDVVQAIADAGYQVDFTVDAVTGEGY